MNISFRGIIFIFMMILAAQTVLMGQSPKKKILFFGDSITELGVKKGGYIDLIAEKIRAAGQDDHFELMGAGVSGNKIYDLYLRMDDDVLARHPDVVVMFIGVNDIWHKRLLGTGTDFDKFGKFYSAIVGKLRAANIKVVVCTPAVIGERTDESNELDGDLNLYSGWIRTFASNEGLTLVDLRSSFLKYDLEHNTKNEASGILTVDKVHLNDRGNALVADEIWKSLKEM